MNFSGPQLYATFDRAYQLHNSNSVDYLSSIGQLANNQPSNEQENYTQNINNQLLTTNLIPIPSTTDPATYLSIYDPTYLNHQLSQSINGSIYPNTMGYHQFSYTPDNSYIGLQNAYLTNPEFYRNLVNYNQNRQFNPHVTYNQPSQIPVLNNLQVGNNQPNDPNNCTSDISVNNKNLSTTNSNYENSNIQDGVNLCNFNSTYRTQDSTNNYKRNFKSFRNKTKHNQQKSNQLSGNDTNNRNSKQNYLFNSNITQNDEFHDLPNCNIGSNQCVELIITNLDYNINAKEWKKLLYNQFQNVIKRVISIYIQTHTDGSNCAIVKLTSLEDARLAISQFHRKKIGYKRIQVNLLTSNTNTAPNNIKQEVASLLKSVAGYSLSVFKFMELFEKRYHKSISVLDLYKMQDFIEIKDIGGNQNGKIISLTNTGINYITQTDPVIDASAAYESPICPIHCKETAEEYTAINDSTILPNVKISLGLFKKQVYQILQSHNGTVPLLSFIACYKAEFDDLEVLEETNLVFYQHNIDDSSIGDSITNNYETQNINYKHDDNKSTNDNYSLNEGVPIEHLILCVPNVKILTSVGGLRKVILDENRDTSNKPFMDNGSLGLHLQMSGLGGVLVDRLHQFSREVVDLMKHQPGCSMLLSKFIPTYHHHFGKQCRVADYGFSKLHELIDALPHVVHVIGSGYVRQLYLSHKVQLRRFTNELTKVLKSQPTKLCLLTDYPQQYKLLFHKDFHIIDYGVCYIEDLIEDIPENTVEKLYNENEVVLTMPKRIQTLEEKEKTIQFAIEVIDLLKQSPRCRLPFNKFIPSYHHHFSRQCKVAEYGFAKLIELLDAIPHAVQIMEDHGEKYVLLTKYEQLKVFAEQTLNILEKSPDKCIRLSEFPNVYMKLFGYALHLDDYEVTSMPQLFQQISKAAKLQQIPMSHVHMLSQASPDFKFNNCLCNQSEISIENDSMTENDTFVCMADRLSVKYMTQKLLMVLLEAPNCMMSKDEFQEKYFLKYRENPDLDIIKDELAEIVQIIGVDQQSSKMLPSSTASSLLNTNVTKTTDATITEICALQLTTLVRLSKDLREILRLHQGKLTIHQLENSYEQKHGYALQSARYGYPTLYSLLQACSYALSIKGRGLRTSIFLIQDFVGKLAYKVAYSTEPTIRTNHSKYEASSKSNMNLESDLNKSVSDYSSMKPNEQKLDQTSKSDVSQKSSSLTTPSNREVTSLSQKPHQKHTEICVANTISNPQQLNNLYQTTSQPVPLLTAPQPAQSSCFIQPTPLYNPNIYTPNSYTYRPPHHYYFNPANPSTPVFNPWIRPSHTNQSQQNWYAQKPITTPSPNYASNTPSTNNIVNNPMQNKDSTLTNINENIDSSTTRTTINPNSTILATNPPSTYPINTPAGIYGPTDYSMFHHTALTQQPSIINSPNLQPSQLPNHPTLSTLAPLPYITATQDQKQIDELVETLAYDNSSTMAMSPPISAAPTTAGALTSVPNIMTTTTPIYDLNLTPVGSASAAAVARPNNSPWYNYTFLPTQQQHPSQHQMSQYTTFNRQINISDIPSFIPNSLPQKQRIPDIDTVDNEKMEKNKDFNDNKKIESTVVEQTSMNNSSISSSDKLVKYETDPDKDYDNHRNDSDSDDLNQQNNNATDFLSKILYVNKEKSIE